MGNVHEMLDALPCEVQIDLGEFGDTLDGVDSVDEAADL